MIISKNLLPRSNHIQQFQIDLMDYEISIKLLNQRRMKLLTYFMTQNNEIFLTVIHGMILSIWGPVNQIFDKSSS